VDKDVSTITVAHDMNNLTHSYRER